MKLDNGMFESKRAAAVRKQTMQHRAEKAQARSTLLRKIDMERAEERAWKKVLFCLWYILDKKLEELEDIGQGKSNPDLIRTRDDVWYAYINIDRPEFRDFV